MCFMTFVSLSWCRLLLLQRWDNKWTETEDCRLYVICRYYFRLSVQNADTSAMISSGSEHTGRHTQCAARVPRRGTQLHLATFANFSQREQRKFKQWCKWINCNFVVFELFEIFFSHKLLVFVRGEQPEVSQVCADVPCEGCWCTASGTQHRN